jgi:Endosomal/lysosomal potassium channel TMEM175
MVSTGQQKDAELVELCFGPPVRFPTAGGVSQSRHFTLLIWMDACALLRGTTMHEEKITADRLATFSDAVFAVIVTIMVLELKAPDQPAFWL